MVRHFSEIVLRLAGFIGLGTSVLLIVEYRDPAAALCAAGGGCDLVRQSSYAHMLGVSLPIWGALFFATLLTMMVVPPVRRWLFPLSALGGLGAIGLLALQAFAIGAFCRLCVVVDLAAITAAVAAFHSRSAPVERWNPLDLGAHAATAVALSIAALSWHAAQLPQAEPALSTQMALPTEVQGQSPLVTVVEFVDFQCPACRAQHGEMKEVLDSYAGRLNVVLKHLPLPQHQHAVDAARAFCCAEESGRAAEMADRLFRAERLSPPDCEEIAVGLGMDRDAFRSCVRSPAVAERIRKDQDNAVSAGVRGLPTFWIGRERFEGVQPSTTIRDSIERALRTARS